MRRREFKVDAARFTGTNGVAPELARQPISATADDQRRQRQSVARSFL